MFRKGSGHPVLVCMEAKSGHSFSFNRANKLTGSHALANADSVSAKILVVSRLDLQRGDAPTAWTPYSPLWVPQFVQKRCELPLRSSMSSGSQTFFTTV